MYTHIHIEERARSRALNTSGIIECGGGTGGGEREEDRRPDNDVAWLSSSPGLGFYVSILKYLVFGKTCECVGTCECEIEIGVPGLPG